MVFSSLSFLIVFLPALTLIFFTVPAGWKHARQYVLLFFSLLFYGSGEPLYIFLILICITTTWLLSRQIEEGGKTALIAALLVNIIPLAVTKYAGFIIANINALAGVRLPIPRIVMPIGISFYTFQVITYVADLYCGRIRRQSNVFLFALYIMFFPQLIAGPIVRYPEIEKELEKPDVSADNIRYGAGRFVTGLGKKVLLANQAGYIVSSIMKNPVSSLSTGMTWLCLLAYTIQIYFDFSGYSEMAIGLGAIFGFHFPENFKDPYTALSVTDFWRKWHMTLGRFFREYVYIPLGGNRVSRIRWTGNILTVWALTGLWHGASWNYVIWGLYYGLLIIAERSFGLMKKLPKPAAWLVTFFLVVFGWGIFLCDGFTRTEILAFLSRLFYARDVSKPVTIGSLKLWGYLPFLLVGGFLSTPPGILLRDRLSSSKTAKSTVGAVIHDAGLIGVFLLSLLFLVGSTYNPFIYFRF